MSKIVYYSLAGSLATLIALSLIKRKPSMKKIPVNIQPQQLKPIGKVT